MKVEINRQLLGLEDQLFGVGTVTQVRNGQNVIVTKINAANLPFNETQSLKTVLANMPNLDIVAPHVANIDTVATSIANVNTLAPIASDIDILSPQAANIGVVALNVNSVVTTAVNIDGVNIVAADISQASYSDIEDLGLITQPVTVNPAGTTSYIKVVADNIIPVTTVGTNIASVSTTAGSIVNVNTVATDIVNVNSVATTVVPNIAELLLVNDNAALVVGLLDQFDDRYLGSKVIEPALDNDGNALLVGALYFDSVTNKMRVYGSDLLWSDALTLTAGSISTLTNKTIDSITNQIGANHVHHECRNVSGVTIPKGTVVTAQGAQSGTDYVEIIPITNPQTQIALGITHADILNNGIGLVMNTGVCTDVINTSAWVVGTILYPNTTGGLTNIKPTTGVYQACAVVLRSHLNQGTMLIEFTEPRDTTAKILADVLASGIPIDMGSIV